MANKIQNIKLFIISFYVVCLVLSGWWYEIRPSFIAPIANKADFIINRWGGVPGINVFYQPAYAPRLISSCIIAKGTKENGDVQILYENQSCTRPKMKLHMHGDTLYFIRAHHEIIKLGASKNGKQADSILRGILKNLCTKWENKIQYDWTREYEDYLTNKRFTQKTYSFVWDCKKNDYDISK